MRDPLYLAIDQGGHGSRTLAFDVRGRLVAKAGVEIGTGHPRPGWVEQDPEELLHSIRTTVQSVVRDLESRAGAIKAAGLATQRSTIVCWDRDTGKAISPAISWQDRRAQKWLHGVSAHGEHIHRATGLFLTAYYGAGKLRWCLDHLPAVRAAHRDGRLAYGPLAAFLTFRLLQERPLLIDPANAARTLLWNIETRDWDPALLKLFDLPAAPLPRCVPTRHAYGWLSAGGRNIPLRVVTGDQPAALFARGRPGAETAYINIGTGAFIQQICEGYPGSFAELLTGIVYEDGSNVIYVREGTVNGAGSALQWAEKELGIQQVEAKIAAWLQRAEAPPLFLNGVSGLGSPFWTPDFASRFLGDGEDWEKIVAVVESIVFLLQVNLANMMGLSAPPLQRIVVTGGLAVLDGLCQRLADLGGLPVYRPVELEATARGTAFLTAGCPDPWPEAKAGAWFRPRPNAALADRYRRWHQSLLGALR